MNKSNQTQSDVALKVGALLDRNTSSDCRCGKEGDSDHTCPYAEDINGDSESLCNCCSDCIDNCAQDI